MANARVRPGCQRPGPWLLAMLMTSGLTLHLEVAPELLLGPRVGSGLSRRRGLGERLGRAGFEVAQLALGRGDDGARVGGRERDGLGDCR